MKSRAGKRQRRKKIRRKKSRRERVRKKEDADARKGKKVAKHCVFPIIWGSGRSKSRLAKAAGAELAGQMRDWKIARRCRAKHISKSKCTKYTRSGPFLAVEMSKKCTPLWREAHFELKMLKTPGVRTTFGGSDVASLRFTTLHYTPLHYITLQLHNYTPLHSTTLNYTTLHYITLHSTPLHYTPLHYKYNYNYTTTLHYTPLHSPTLHYTKLHYTKWHYITLHYTTLHSTTTLHYTTLHNTTTTTTLHR